ncbi:hypothetical protein EK21DRAFT_66336, partial [Setomelanomma holmii]
SPSPPRTVSKRRGRRSSVSNDDLSEPVIGQVTLSGRFRCLDQDCSDVSFARQADFRRHWDNAHATSKLEYFCLHEGCLRSKKPTGKSKGKSFGAREDKMHEHMRTVHGKKNKRKKIVHHDDDDEGRESKNDHQETEDNTSRAVTKERRVTIHEGQHDRALRYGYA